MTALVLLALVPVAASAASTPHEVPEGSRVMDAHPAAQQGTVRGAADALTRRLEAGRISRARYALLRARSLFDLAEVRRDHGHVRAPDAAAATPILQRLALDLDRLSGGSRTRATSLLKRPTDGPDDRFDDGYTTDSVSNRCVTKLESDGDPRRVCVHWVETTVDAPPLADLNANQIPDQIDATIAVLSDVWDAEILGMGFRPPLADGGSAQGQGPNTGVDVYVADVGDDGLFGYCAADPSTTKRLRAPAYCVLDDDYDPAQFEAPSPSGLDALRIATAHEFFHAIQFAYEFSGKDQWLKEGTAVWMEDQVYDQVNAGYSYLPESALHQPEIPLNAFGSDSDAQDFEYGAWVFWRFLSEYYGGPTVIRAVWQKTAPTRRRDRSALDSVVEAISARQPDGPCLLRVPCAPTSFRRLFAEFVAWNGVYPITYEEGFAYLNALANELPPVDGVFELDAAHPGTGSRQVRVDHLSARRISFDLGGAPAGADLRVNVNLPDRPRGPEASLEIFSGMNVSVGYFGLDADGNDSAVVQNPDRVTLNLVNTSGALDDEPYRYSAVIP